MIDFAIFMLVGCLVALAYWRGYINGILDTQKSRKSIFTMDRRVRF